MGCTSAAATCAAACVGGGGTEGGQSCGMERTGKPCVGGGRERASATTLSDPGVCLKSVVNSEI
jgi:hypothetical protein